MRKISFLLTFCIFTNFAFAHDILYSLSKEQLTQVQQNLVAKGYLEMSGGAVYGVLSSSTEVAFDKFQNDRVRQDISQQYYNNSATTTDNQVEVSFWQSLVEWFVSLLKSLF